MQSEFLVHNSRLTVGDEAFEVSVFSRPGGSHFAKTVLAPGDVIINDGPTLEEALAKHQSLLPLAILSRRFLRESDQRG